MSLDVELQTYKNKLHDLLADEGKFALIKGEIVAGIYDTYEDAIKSGYEKYKLEAFLVKQIQSVEQVQYITRSITSCRT